MVRELMLTIRLPMLGLLKLFLCLSYGQAWDRRTTDDIQRRAICIGGLLAGGTRNNMITIIALAAAANFASVLC